MNMSQQVNQKVTASHLKRQAYCYVRQSTLKQVFENTESTKRQYALRERAVALGWPVVQIVTVDSDLGETATSVADRKGFQKLMTEVSLGRVGLVMGLGGLTLGTQQCGLGQAAGDLRHYRHPDT